MAWNRRRIPSDGHVVSTFEEMAGEHDGGQEELLTCRPVETARSGCIRLRCLAGAHEAWPRRPSCQRHRERLAAPKHPISMAWSPEQECNCSSESPRSSALGRWR